VGTPALETLSELAMVAAYASVHDPQPDAPAPLELRIAIIVVRDFWTGPLRAKAFAERCPGHGWLLGCELSTQAEGTVSRAFAYARNAPSRP
jgi:hypothetical protein